MGVLVWFQNHSLRFKIVILMSLLVLLLQNVNGIIFFSMTTDKFEKSILESNQATVNQMATNMNRIFEDIVTEMVDVRNQITSYQLTEQGDAGQEEYAARSIRYQELFNQLIVSHDNSQFVNSMFVLGEKGECYSYTLYSYMQTKKDNLFQQILKKYEFESQVVWGSLIEETEYFTKGDRQLLSIIMPVYRYHTVKNLLVVNLDVEGIQKYLRDLNGEENKDNMILIQVKEGESFSYDGMEQILEESPELKQIFDRELSGQQIVGDKYCVLSSKLAVNHWTVSMVTLLSSIQNTTSSMAEFILVILITTVIIMLAGVSVIVYTITKPIQKMTQIMEANRHTKALNHRFHAKYNDEVGVLARTYNSLMDEISQLMDEIHREQIQNRNSYFKMLQMQIKPHFLYNTLESVKFMVEMRDEKSVDMLAAIGKFYKLSLSGIYDIVKIKEEVEHLTCYLQILKMRYSSRYSYEISVPEEIQKEDIVKFTLQPLVENAIYHGIKEKRQKGMVRITGEIQQDTILLTVWDNGAGIPQEKLETLKKQMENPREIELKEHIGVLNVHQRIYVQYGKRFGLHIESVFGEYTQVQIRLPYCGGGKSI